MTLPRPTHRDPSLPATRQLLLHPTLALDNSRHKTRGRGAFLPTPRPRHLPLFHHTRYQIHTSLDVLYCRLPSFCWERKRLRIPLSTVATLSIVVSAIPTQYVRPSSAACSGDTLSAVRGACLLADNTQCPTYIFCLLVMFFDMVYPFACIALCWDLTGFPRQQTAQRIGIDNLTELLPLPISHSCAAKRLGTY